MSKQTDLISDYNEFILQSAARVMAGELSMEDVPSLMREYLHEDVILHEAESLPWGGTWNGPMGFLGEAQAFMTGFGGRYSFTAVGDVFDQVDETLVFHTFDITVSSIAAQSRTYLWRGIERYEVRDDKIALIDVFYKDTAGLLSFIAQAD